MRLQCETPPISLLIQRAGHGDHQAWAQLVRKYRPRVLTWCRANLIPMPDAEDVCQDVLLKLYRCIGKFRQRSVNDSFSGWLFLMTKRMCIDHLRRQSRSQERWVADRCVPLESLADKTTDPCRQMEQYEINTNRMRLIRRLVQQEFNETYGRVFEAVAFQERSPGDIAQELGITINAVHLAKSRMFRRLKHLVKN